MSINKRLFTGAAAGPWMGTATFTGSSSTITLSGASSTPEFALFFRNETSNAYTALVDRYDPYYIYYAQYSSRIGNGSATTITWTSDGIQIPSNTYTTNFQLGMNINTHTCDVVTFSAGGSLSTNTDGSIDSQVSANPDNGFSIVKYTGTGNEDTIGHGLSSQPRIIVMKSSLNNPEYITSIRKDNGDWVASPSNDNKAFAVKSANVGSGVTADSSVMTIRNGGDDRVGDSNQVITCYCFTDSADFGVDWFEYTGNGSTTQRNFSTGFDPKFWIAMNDYHGTSVSTTLHRANSGNAATQWEISDYHDGGRKASLGGSSYINFDNANDRIEFSHDGYVLNHNTRQYYGLAFGGDKMETLTVS
jgi:hypothetical protein